MASLTKEQLHELFSYSDGMLTYKPRGFSQFDKRWAGFSPSTPKPNGYIYVAVDKQRLLAHRVIYAMHHGEWPEQVDHIDGNSTNNRIENLRKATAKTNARNHRMRKDNTSGCTGVYQIPSGSWRVRVLGKSVGCYETLELAELVYNEVKLSHGCTTRHGVSI